MIKRLIQNRIKHREAQLAWKEDVDFSNMSPTAKSFSAGQAQGWVSDIYFLKGLIEKIESEE